VKAPALALMSGLESEDLSALESEDLLADLLDLASDRG